MVRLVRLKKGADKTVKKWGWLTIYNKWILDDGGAEPGDEVIIETFDRESLGVGIFDGVGAVGVRLLSPYIAPVSEIIERNILTAYNFRKTLGWKSFRLINSEGDSMPGLIIDIYNEIGVIQSGSAGFDYYLDYISKILVRHGIVEKVYVRNDQRSRREVGLEIWKGWIYGGGETETIVDEDGVLFKVDIERGQKTGFFLDQRMNRIEGRIYSRDKTVLDLYSYTGGFGIHALTHGSRKAYFIEEDPKAIEILYENLKLNKVEDKAEVYNIRVEKFFNENQMKFNLLFSDPPALIPARKNYDAGIKKYIWLLNNILANVERNATIFFSSCSYFLKPNEFLELIDNTISEANLNLTYLGRLRGASPDHVYRPTDDELNYLKAIYFLIR